MDCVAAFATDVTVFCHFIAINVAVGAALGDDRLIVFRPDNGSITKIAANNGKLELVALGSEAQNARQLTAGDLSQVVRGSCRRSSFGRSRRRRCPALRRLGRYVFGDSDADEEDDDILRPEWTHAAFHQGRLVASSAGYSLQGAPERSRRPRRTASPRWARTRAIAAAASCGG